MVLGIRIAHALTATPGLSWHLARQIGLTAAVGIASPNEVPIWDFLTLARLKARYESFGYELEVIEGWLPMDNIRQGSSGADEEIELVIKTIENMGALGIPVLCYNWMAHYLSWIRTSFHTKTRGGALTTSFDAQILERMPDRGPKITQDQLWSTLKSFLTKVLPVAEKAGVKLAMHPDDPPLANIGNVGRIFYNVEGFERLIDMFDSESNGITLCQGNFAAMGVDIPATVKSLVATGRVHFAHFRDIQGTAENFTEVFHDDGKTDMFAAMCAYLDAGFDGPMRLDHSPTVEGDPHENPGYEPHGRLFAIGYMKGLLQAAQATAEQRQRARS